MTDEPKITDADEEPDDKGAELPDVREDPVPETEGDE